MKSKKHKKYNNYKDMAEHPERYIPFKLLCIVDYLKVNDKVLKDRRGIENKRLSDGHKFTAKYGKGLPAISFGLGKEYLFSLLERIDRIDREILLHRAGIEEFKTFKALGEMYGISLERVRQREARALHKVRGLIKRDGEENIRYS